MNTEALIRLFSDGYPLDEMRMDIDKGFAMLQDFERRFSRFVEGNELWRFNHSSVAVLSYDLCVMLTCAKRYYALTDGIFDPSILGALRHEGYRVGRQDGYLGDVSDIEDSMSSSDFSRLVVDETLLQAEKPERMMIDLGGIAKGYIIDKVADSLAAKYENVLVDIGGDMRALGGDRGQDVAYWPISIEHPIDDMRKMPLLALSEMAVATSGINRRYWFNEGKRKHHLIDPRTRKSVETDALSVTVIAKKASEADVWAKTFLISGIEAGMRWSERVGLPAVFVASDGSVLMNRYVHGYIVGEYRKS